MSSVNMNSIVNGPKRMEVKDWMQTRRYTPAISSDRSGSLSGPLVPIHMNAAGASLMSIKTITACQDYLTYEMYSGGYEAIYRAENGEDNTSSIDFEVDMCDGKLNGDNIRRVKGLVKHVKDNVATLVNCKPKEVGIVFSATEAWRQLFCGTPWTYILTSVVDYGTNVLSYLQSAEKYKSKIIIVPNDATASISIKDLDETLFEITKRDSMDKADRKHIIVSISHIATSQGGVQPAEEVGSICTKYEVPFLLDACQSVGQLPVDMEKIQCSALTSTSRKYIRGPRGVGFLAIKAQWMDVFQPSQLDVKGSTLQLSRKASTLHISEEALELLKNRDPNIYEILNDSIARNISNYSYTMADDATRYEQYEHNFSDIAGFSSAIQEVLEIGIENIWSRIQSLSSFMRMKLSEFDYITVHDAGPVKCGIVSFSMNGVDSDYIKRWMADNNIFVHTSRRSSTLAYFETYRLPQSVVRASLHYYNTEDEILGLVHHIKHIYSQRVESLSSPEHSD